MGFKVNVPNKLLKNPDKSNVNKPYSQYDIDFMHENACKISIPEIAYHLKRSTWSIQCKMNEIGIFLSESCKGHDYIFERDFIRELEQIPGMTKWIYYELRDKKIIKVNMLKVGWNYLDLDTYEYWIQFFKNHTTSSYFINNTLMMVNKRYKQSLLLSGNIKRVKFDNRSKNKYWVNNDDIKRVEYILTKCYTLPEIAKSTGYTIAGIKNMITRSYVNLDCFTWNRKKWFTPDDYTKIKQYANRFLDVK